MIHTPASRTVAKARAPRLPDRGFTLVEVVIAIVLVGILSAVVVVGVGQLTNRGTTAACTTSADAAHAAATTHLGTTGAYPTTFTAMTTASPPTLTLPTGATIDATGRIATVGSWNLVLVPGTGSQAPRFTCWTDVPTGFTLGPTGSYYRFVTTAASWPDARSAAATFSANGRIGHLATITSAAEQTFVSGLRASGTAWLGATVVGSTGTWRWVDGPEAGTQFSSFGTPVSGAYTSWRTSTGEPNSNSVAMCLRMEGSSLWNDHDCISTAGYMVEISP